MTKALNYYNETLLMFSDGCIEQFVDHFIEFCSFERFEDFQTFRYIFMAYVLYREMVSLLRNVLRMTGNPLAAICRTTGCGVKLLQSYFTFE